MFTTNSDYVDSSSIEVGESSRKGQSLHGGRYSQHSINGIVFELPTKYVGPFELIERGSYVFVCSAFNSETNEKVAIQKIKHAFYEIEVSKTILRDIKLLSQMDRINVIAMKDVVRPRNKETFRDVYIVYEFMETNLHQMIETQKDLPEEHYKLLLYQILRGLKYIHSGEVLHLDLKPMNLLVNKNCELKIADFGFAIPETPLETEHAIPLGYCAPEVLLGNTQYTRAVGNARYTRAIDVWAVGCIFAEMVTMAPLFPAKDYSEELRMIFQLIGSPDEESLGFLGSESARKYVRDLYPQLRQNFSTRFPNMKPDAIDLLEKMLVFDPRKRITVQEALCHPYLSRLHNDDDEPVCSKPFILDVENHNISKEGIKELVWQELVKFTKGRY